MWHDIPFWCFCPLLSVFGFASPSDEDLLARFGLDEDDVPALLVSPPGGETLDHTAERFEWTRYDGGDMSYSTCHTAVQPCRRRACGCSRRAAFTRAMSWCRCTCVLASEMGRHPPFRTTTSVIVVLALPAPRRRWPVSDPLTSRPRAAGGGGGRTA